MQSPSFLDYQRRMQKERGRNNARSLFGVHQIPSTQQIGNLLDPISPGASGPGVHRHRRRPHRHRALDLTARADGRLLDRAGRHRVSLLRRGPLCAVLHAHAQQRPDPVLSCRRDTGDRRARTGGRVPFAAGVRRPQDGHAKQDCELKAATRWLQQWGARIAPGAPPCWGMTCTAISRSASRCSRRAALSVRLPAPSHPALYEWVADFERSGAVPTWSRPAGRAPSVSPRPIVGSTTCRCATATMPCRSAGAN